MPYTEGAAHLTQLHMTSRCSTSFEWSSPIWYSGCSPPYSAMKQRCSSQVKQSQIVKGGAPYTAMILKDAAHWSSRTVTVDRVQRTLYSKDAARLKYNSHTCEGVVHLTQQCHIKMQRIFQVEQSGCSAP